MNKALILAAGYGSRLAPLTDCVPKSLGKVKETPILFKQIDNLYENGIGEIVVVSGYKADALKDMVLSKYPDITIVESKEYATTNNMYSAYLVKDFFIGEPFLMMNADVYFDSSVIKALLDFDKENAIVVDFCNYIDESMKVVERGGRLTEISKTVSRSDALGSSIDVYRFSADGGGSFFEKCREYIENRRELKLWSEVALNDVLKEGRVPFYPCALNGRWMEIDTLEDLENAEEIFAED